MQAIDNCCKVQIALSAFLSANSNHQLKPIDIPETSKPVDFLDP